jgi:hypothetical protein
LAHRYPDVFGCVMQIDVQIPGCAYLEIDEGMPGKKLEHVVEETNAG